MSHALKSFRSLAVLLALAGALFLHGCATPPITPSERPRSAEHWYSQGDFIRAAESWTREALQVPPTEAGSRWVRAADAWELAGRSDKALEAMRRTTRNELGPNDRSRYDLVLAALALEQGRFDEAEAFLEAASKRLPPELTSRYEAIQESYLLQVSGTGTADLSGIERMISTMETYEPALSLQLLESLEPVSSAELSARGRNPMTEQQLAGWLDLALVIRHNLVEMDAIAQESAAWQARHPEHLLGSSEALDLALRYRQGFRPPARVAVIVPGAGRLKSAGDVIRDGMMAAFMDAPQDSELLFFPTNDEEGSTVSAYFSALDAGADLVVGPLRRENVEALLGVPGISMPILALNDLPADLESSAVAAGTVRAISLSQDEEARSVARHAARSGHRRAMVLLPLSGWGSRIGSAFSDEFLQDGRQILEEIRYPLAQNDHSMLLQTALKIDESKARRTLLENTLGQSVEFEPVRRDDIDVIFMAAEPVQARQIRPQLKFHDAGNIPVYATGRAFSGEPDPVRNRDLDGVRIPSMRWQIENSDADTVPPFASLRAGARSGLFALGMDAWNLLPWLELMRRSPDFRFHGQSGTWRDEGNGQFVREPAWAVFENGRPVPLDTDPVNR